MKEHTLYFILLCLVTIVIYAGYMQATVYGQEKLKFNTQEVREMWYACSIEFQKITATGSKAAKGISRKKDPIVEEPSQEEE